jgi:peptidyl-prolyl cis-trans isomerase SurA
MTDLRPCRRSLGALRLALLATAAVLPLSPATAQLRVNPANPAERAAGRPAQGSAEGGDARATERAASRAADRSATRAGDYIVAIVNQELVTATEVERRVQRVREDAARGRTRGRLPPDPELRRQIVDALIDERVILTYSRESGLRIDDAELDRAVQSVAAQNQLTVDQLRGRLSADGIDFARFRSNLRDQLLVERTREREVLGRIRVSDADVDRFIAEQRQTADTDPEINLAQILVSVPEGAGDAVVTERRARAEEALARVRRGEAFDEVAREISEDPNRARGGELGPRPASRLPDLFVEATRGLKSGDVAPQVVRSGAGFHVLKVLAVSDPASPRVTQTRVRHILLRVSPRLSAEQAQARLAEYRRAIESRTATFEDLARQFSEDGSAAQGGDLGWTSPGMMVPEFERAMSRLPVGGISPPVASRFGWHLIEVVDRRTVETDPRQLREQARSALREQKFDQAYADWVKELRARSYVELREPPL